MRKLPGRMALLAGGEETKVTGTTVTSAPVTYKTMTTRDSGERYGANTETSSTQCNVSNTDRQVGFDVVVIVYLMYFLLLCSPLRE